MTGTAGGAERRAARLMRWYPAAWRARYGDEFTELLIAEFAERPRSWRRAADVARSGLLARLTGAGLTGQLEPSEQIRAGLVTAVCSLAGSLAFGVAMWAQLTVGWEWAPPSATATRVGMVAMSAAALLLAALAVLAVPPLAVAAALGMARGRARCLRGPLLLAVAGAMVLAIGSHHFQNAWPGTGGHSWAQQGLVPGGVAAFSWAATLSVSSYWAHPAALSTFPAAEIAWMAVSPLALIALVAGVAGTMRRLDWPARLLRYESWLVSAAAVGMTTFLAGGCCWVLAGGSRPGLFHAGVVDVASLAVMILGLYMARRATGRVRKPALGERPH